jgi:hypothetical protein
MMGFTNNGVQEGGNMEPEPRSFQMNLLSMLLV